MGNCFMNPLRCLFLWNGAGAAFKNEGNMVCWSDLPLDIVSCVASRLEPVDLIRIRAVCKSWRKVDEEKPLQWIFLGKEDHKPSKPPHYYLCEMRHKKLYPISLRWTTRMRLQLRLERLLGEDAKLGWFLLKQNSDRLFLFSPFTPGIVNLPKIPSYDGYGFIRSRSTFSYCPKSRRFVVYITYLHNDGRYIIINRWETGDRKWEPIKFLAKFPKFMRYIVHLHVVGASLYCVFNFGIVGSFDEPSKTWDVVVNSEDDKFFSSFKAPLYRNSDTFEFRGELLMIDRRGLKEGILKEPILWRLDRYRGRWTQVVSATFCSYSEPLEFGALFPGDTTAYYCVCPSRRSGVITKDCEHVHAARNSYLYVVNIKFPWRQEQISITVFDSITRAVPQNF